MGLGGMATQHKGLKVCLVSGDLIETLYFAFYYRSLNAKIFRKGVIVNYVGFEK